MVYTIHQLHSGLFSLYVCVVLLALTEIVVMSGIRKAFRRSQRESKKRRGQLSPREVDADAVREILKSIKETAKGCQELHSKWEDDQTFKQFNSDYLAKANTLIRHVDNFREILELTWLKTESKEINDLKASVKKLARERDDAEYRLEEVELEISSLKKRLGEQPLSDRGRRERQQEYMPKCRSEQANEYEQVSHALKRAKQDWRLDRKAPSRTPVHRNESSSSSEGTRRDSKYYGILEREVHELKRQIASLHEEKKPLSDSRDDTMKKLNEARDEVERYKKQMENSDAILARSQQELEHLKYENRSLMKMKGDVELSLNQLKAKERNFQNDVDKIQKDLTKEKEAKEEALISLQHSKSNEENIRDTIDRLKRNASAEREAMDEALIRSKQEFKHLEDENRSLKKTKEEIEQSLHQLKAKERHVQNDVDRIQIDLTKERQAKEEALNRLSDNSVGTMKALKDAKGEVERYKKQMEGSDATLARSQQELEHMKNENRSLKKIKEEVEQSLNQLKARDGNFQSNVDRIQRDLTKERQAKEEALNSLRHSKSNEENLRDTIDRLQRNVSAEREAKDEALIRLSAVTGNKLRDNIPAISDLSDPNRPMKLAEKVSELYDNEWIDAMENLENDMEEQEAIKVLLDILATVFRTCADSGDAQVDFLSSLQLHIAVPDIDNLRRIARSSLLTSDKLTELPTEIMKPLMNYRKGKCELVSPLLCDVIKTRLKQTMTDKTIEACDKFINATVRYVWMMRVQDPPVCMEWEFSHGEKFDHDRLRSYTKGGDSVDYVVWPVIYLHKGGPMLAKGVAQGIKTKEK
ncbi:myosin heavy chain, fast skeletal muscle-like isoform X1 [Argopecten irradians]|uniref:myosin heavy chain, fast skeletal muscle-like isoform X1 n=1 Tax=Argopecten irradians TaxID=31199 RepID=UPI00371CF4E6